MIVESSLRVIVPVNIIRLIFKFFEKKQFSNFFFEIEFFEIFFLELKLKIFF